MQTETACPNGYEKARGTGNALHTDGSVDYARIAAQRLHDQKMVEFIVRLGVVGPHSFTKLWISLAKSLP